MHVLVATACGETNPAGRPRQGQSYCSTTAWPGGVRLCSRETGCMMPSPRMTNGKQGPRPGGTSHRGWLHKPKRGYFGFGLLLHLMRFPAVDTNHTLQEDVHIHHGNGFDLPGGIVSNAPCGGGRQWHVDSNIFEDLITLLAVCCYQINQTLVEDAKATANSLFDHVSEMMSMRWCIPYAW